MRVRLLELLRCPTCPGALVSRAARTATTAPGPTCRRTCGVEGRPLEPAGPCAACPTLDVLEGVLECRSCAAVFPIRDGVPVLVAGGASTEAEATRSVYARMRLSFGEPGPEDGQAEAWAENFRENVGEA